MSLPKRRRVGNTGNLFGRTAAFLRRYINSRYEAGDRLDSVAALASTLKVSTNTIRGALAVLVREGMVVVRHGSGTYVQEAAVGLRVGILIEQNVLSRRVSTFFADVVDELRRHLAAQGSRPRLYIGTVNPGGEPGRSTCWDFLEDISLLRLDGVAAVGTDPNPSWQTILDAGRIPVVGTSSLFPYRVTTDLPADVREAVRRLAAAGCRRVALLSPIVARVDAAFRESLAAAGMEYRSGWVRGDLCQSFPGAGWEEFREIWTASPEKPDGLICGDDFLFRDAMLAISEMGISVPGQLQIVSHSNKGSGLLAPYPATLAEYDPRDFAVEMGRMLLRRLRREDIPEPHVVVHPRWIEVEGTSEHLRRIREGVVA